MAQSDASGASPSSQPRRSPWRFSLRTLLLLTTVLAIWLGYMTHRARQQERAVKVVQGLGGIVAYDYQFDADGNYLPQASPPGPAWLRQIIGPHIGTEVVTVELAQKNGKVTNKDLEALQSLRGLKSLWLSSNPAITDDGLKNIRNLTSLESLNLNRTGISDAGLENLKNLKKLSSLMLGGCQIDGSGLRYVRHLPITYLHLNYTRITDANLKHVGAMHSLEELELQSAPITGKGLVHLRELTNVRSLHLHYTLVDDSGLPHLEGLTKLKSLLLNNTKVTEEGLQTLERALPDLPTISASWSRVRVPPDLRN